MFQNKFFFTFHLYIYLLIFFCADAQELIVFSDTDIKNELIDSTFKESNFLLEEVSFESDSFFQESEFLYLTGLKKGEITSLQDLKNAIFYLKHKNKFEQIILYIQDGQSGKKIKFILKSVYLFNKLKIKGLFFGKDRYIQSYYLEHADKFDINKHEKSLQKIKKDYSKQGYFNVNLLSNFKYDENNKLITVYLKIEKGQKYNISNISFQISGSSLNNLEIEKLTLDLKNNFFKKFLKKSYSWNSIKKTQKKAEQYIKKQGFNFVDIKLKKKLNKNKCTVNLEFVITLSKKRNWKFVGNKYLSDSKLLDFVLNQGKFVTELPPSILAQEFNQFYKNNGFWQNSVESIEEIDSCIFKINEGPRATIEKIIINNCLFLNEKQIINKFFKLFLSSKYINEDKLAQAIDNLTSFYLKSGFWDVKIEKKINPMQEYGKYIIEITISEGKRRFLNSIKIENFQELEHDKKFAFFRNLKESIPFDINILSEQQKWLMNHFKKKGCKNIVIKPDFDADENLKISLTWKIIVDQSNNINFGKTIIQGNNNKIPFERIMRELSFTEGDPLDREKIEESYFRLNDLKIFDSVQLYPANFDDLVGNKPAILKLFPDDPFEIRTRIGFEQVNKNLNFKGLATYKVGGTFIFKNPFSFFDFFKIDAEASRFEKLFIARYQIPRFFGFDLDPFYQFYFNKYDEPLYIGSDKIIYKVSNIGFLTGISKKYKKMDYGFNFGFEGTKITDLSIERAKAIDFSPTLLDKRVPYIFFEPNLMIDYLDDKLYPSKGSLTIFSLKTIFSLQNSNDYFLKFLIEQSCFSSFLNPVIFGLRLRFGHIFVNNFSHLMPPIRFYLGGANTIRSYEPDLAPPLGTYIKENGEIQKVPQGGKTMLNVNFEFRIPILKNLFLVLFQDLGFLFAQQKKIDADNLLSATGFGIRYATPIGPIRFDIGWRPKKNNQDSAFMWFITLGQAF